MIAVPNISAEPDVINRRALGALRFVDPVTGQSITEGLSVTARIGNKEILATPSQRGVHIFHQLPGMSTASFWDGETSPVPSAVTSAHVFEIEVRDTSRRFFPTAFKTSFPAWPEAIPIHPDEIKLDKNIPLFSTPWRLPRNDCAIIRGTLRVLSNKQPAAWALIRAYRKGDDVTTAKPVSEGVAGLNGEFMLMFPWPKADPSVLNAPIGLRWTLRIQVLYDIPDPTIKSYESPDGEQRLPQLCSILKQKPATLLAEIDSDVELSLQEMSPDKPLLLKTTGSKDYLFLKTT